MLPLQLGIEKRIALAFFTLLLVYGLFQGLLVGHLPITPFEAISVLSGGNSAAAVSTETDSLRGVVLNIRLPRTLMAAAAGAGLAMAGALMQGLFRNPLADPSLIGVSAGAAMGAVVALVTGIIPLVPGAFLGGVGITWLLYAGARVDGRTHIATMLLMGLAINALGGAVIGFVLYQANESQTRDFFFWMLGSLTRAEVNWSLTLTVLTIVLAGFVIVSRYSNALNALSLGEAEASHLGFNVSRTQGSLILLSSLIVGSTVAACGIIGFVGLIIPHFARLILGPDHKYVVPASSLLGAALLVFADIGIRSGASGEELPLGIITSLLGAPFFIALIFLAKERVWQD